MPDKKYSYHTVIIRIWNEPKGLTQTSWRFSLECPHQGPRLGFTELRPLLEQIECLLRELSSDAPADDATPAEEISPSCG